jgi:hypothetical protein
LSTIQRLNAEVAEAGTQRAQRKPQEKAPA